MFRGLAAAHAHIAQVFLLEGDAAGPHAGEFLYAVFAFLFSAPHGQHEAVAVFGEVCLDFLNGGAAVGALRDVLRGLLIQGFAEHRKQVFDLFLKVVEGDEILFAVIAAHEHALVFLDILEGYEVNFQTVIYGKGTAPKNVETLIDVSKDKAIIISVVKEKYIKEIMDNMEEKYFKTKHGKGISFTISLNSVIGVNLYNFLANNREEEFS